MNLLAGAALTNTVVLLLTWTSCFPLVKNTDDAGIRAVILGVDALTLTFFEEFYRERNTTSNVMLKLGIGLSIYNEHY